MTHCGGKSRRRRRGGMTSEDENRFLAKQKEERREELGNLGDERERGPKVVEGEGKGTRKPSVLAGLVDQRTEPARREAAIAGRRRTRRHKRKHSRRRR
jgi:hypothetical protein